MPFRTRDAGGDAPRLHFWRRGATFPLVFSRLPGARGCQRLLGRHPPRLQVGASGAVDRRDPDRGPDRMGSGGRNRRYSAVRPHGFIGSADDIGPNPRDNFGVLDRPRGEEDASSLQVSALTPREREVLEAAVEGPSARAIASRLSLTEATVRSHLSAIYSKLGVAGRVELLARLNGGPSVPTAGHEIEAERDNPKPGHAGRKNTAVALAAVMTVAVLTAAALLAIQPSSPPSIDLATVSRLITSDAVARLDLSGTTLTITEKSGGQLRVESVTEDQFQPIQIAAVNAAIPVGASSATPASLATDLAILASLAIPVLLLLAILLGLVRLLRRPPPARLAG